MPSFSIEVPGEANPLTENLLVHTLRSASSSDPNQIQTGTKQLQSWERSPGYYKHLQSAYLDYRLPVELRHLAIIQLKNGIDKYWRKTATNAVSKDDKDIIRSRLLNSILHEPDDRLALQDALVVSKIARFEYPQDWPNAIPDLVQTLRSASQVPPLQLARALLALLHIVKELTTGRLQTSRQKLQAASPEIVHVLCGLYVDTVNFWRDKLQDDGSGADVLNAMQLTLLTVRVMRRLLVSGYRNPNRDHDVVSFWNLVQEQLGALIRLRDERANALPSDTHLLLEKNILQLAKLHHGMANEHPAAFALLPNSIDLVRAYWSLAKAYGQSFGSTEAVTGAVKSASIGNDGDAAEDKSTTEKLALRGLLIIRACAKMVHSPAQTFRYHTAEDKAEKAQATDVFKMQLLSQDFVQELMETIITRFFVFRARDLREWEEEPEEWEKREEGDGEDWEFSIRSCAEKLFLDLAINYKEILVQPLLQVFYSVANPANEDILFKDSVYTAIGLAAPVVFEHLDFDAFIRDVLVTEVQKQKPGFNILRRRAAILIGQWITVRCTERRLVHQIFQHLLDKDDPLNDQVVRVTAGRQFSKVADDWETKASDLLPFADAILTRLLHLIDEVELSETKMALLNTISVMVDRMEYHVSPFAEKIVSLLPSLWEGSGDEHLMKQAILTILARLVNAMKADSAPLHSMVFPIIRGAVEPDSGTAVFLLDDAMDLWFAVVVQSQSPASPGVLHLIPYLLPIYEAGSDNLRQAFEITESYVLLAPAHMLSDEIRTPLFSALASLLSTLRSDANGMLCNLVEGIVRAAQSLGGEAAVQQAAADLVQTGFLPKLLQGLRGSWQAHCTTGPLAKDSPVDGIVETDYFAILARLIMGSLSSFCSAVEAAAPDLEGGVRSLDITMKWLLEEWFSHFENIGDPCRRKLMALALTKLLATNQPFILLSLQSLMSTWTDVITELREEATDAGVTGGDSLVYEGKVERSPGSDPEAPEEGRRRQLTYSDDVHTVKLAEFVQRCLRQTVEACGGAEAFEREWVANVDKEVVAGFWRLGIM